MSLFRKEYIVGVIVVATVFLLSTIHLMHIIDEKSVMLDTLQHQLQAQQIELSKLEHSFESHTDYKRRTGTGHTSQDDLSADDSDSDSQRRRDDHRPVNPPPPAVPAPPPGAFSGVDDDAIAMVSPQDLSMESLTLWRSETGPRLHISVHILELLQGRDKKLYHDTIQAAMSPGGVMSLPDRTKSRLVAVVASLERRVAAQKAAETRSNARHAPIETSQHSQESADDSPTHPAGGGGGRRPSSNSRQKKPVPKIPIKLAAPRTDADIEAAIRQATQPIKDPSETIYVVWDFGADGCTGFAMEAIDLTYPFRNGRRPGIRMGVVYGKLCGGLPEEVQEAMTLMRNENMHEWKIDVWISHKACDLYPKFPYRGHVKVSTPPKYIVGRSMIEVTELPRHWHKKAKSVADEIWVPGKFLYPIFSGAGIPEQKLTVVQEALNTELYNPDTVRPISLPGEKGFKFFSMFKWEPRKGWDLLLRAYFEEFSKNEDVVLYLQTYLYMSKKNAHKREAIEAVIHKWATKNGFNISTIPAIEVLCKKVPTNVVPRIFKSMDAFVLPTHGEGWGLPTMQAMGMGLPTIATNWSGLTEFMTPATSYPITVERMVQAKGRDFKKGQLWADPSLSHLKQLMRYVFSHPEEAKRVGQRAAIHIRQNFSPDAVADQIETRLRQIARTLPAKNPDPPKPAPARQRYATVSKRVMHAKPRRVSKTKPITRQGTNINRSRRPIVARPPHRPIPDARRNRP
jgi:glycosyltransferase involved in cell wall biosynthesis